MKKLTNAGDTIIEVLIALAVLAAVLGGAYASTGKSLQATREAQERGEALKIVESQAEKLKAISPDMTSGDFCIKDDTSLSKQTITTGLWGSMHPPACQRVTGITYLFSMKKDMTGNYTIECRWDNIRGGAQARVTIVYRP